MKIIIVGDSIERTAEIVHITLDNGRQLQIMEYDSGVIQISPMDTEHDILCIMPNSEDSVLVELR